MTLWAAHIVHAASLVPAAFLVFGRVRSMAYVLVAAGFAVSFLADLVVLMTDHSWAVLSVYPVVQFGLFAAAFGGWAVVLLLPLLGLIQAAAMGGPDMLVTGVGSAACLYLVGGHPLRGSIFAYCGAASLFWLLMIPARSDPALFMWFWWPYQAARLVAFGLFIRAAHGD